jgi:hypothetical protein
LENFDFSKDKDFLWEYGKPLALDDPTIPEGDRLPVSTADSLEFACILNLKLYSDGNPIGKANDNPILDSRMYDVEWSDGITEELMANIIAENLFSQVDDEGNRYVLLDDIIYHRNTEGYISGDNGFITLDKKEDCLNGYKTMKMHSQTLLYLVKQLGMMMVSRNVIWSRMLKILVWLTLFLKL